MSDTCNAVVTMAVDTKKYGIRIHKALFRQLGEPRYIPCESGRRCGSNSDR